MMNVNRHANRHTKPLDGSAPAFTFAALLMLSVSATWMGCTKDMLQLGDSGEGGGGGSAVRGTGGGSVVGGTGGGNVVGGTGGGNVVGGTGGSSSDGGSLCPAQLPISGGACTGSSTTVCSYGQSTCCGISSSAWTCRCQNGSFLCVMTVECNFICPDAGAQDASSDRPGTGGSGTGGAPGTGGVSGSGGSDGGVASCNVTSDCPPNPGASCAQVCSDGSNPCTFACVSHQCVARGCPGDGGVASPHAEGESCDDGQGCTTGLVCKAIGDPCPTYPNCKVCYLPCQTGGICPNNRICFPPSGQGGDVCLK